MIEEPPGSGGVDPEPALRIGEASSLTGLSPGRIRHYQHLGLIDPERTQGRYRLFRAAELLRLMQIELLRSLGMSLPEIAGSLPSATDPGSLRQALNNHRETLLAEQRRLSHLIEAVELALADPEATPASMTALLASGRSTPRDSLGIFGRLSRPLSDESAALYQRLLGSGWGLPVSPLMGRLVLPAAVTELLERLASADQLEQLFSRIQLLARSILELEGGAGGPAAAAELARGWITQWGEDPPPRDIQDALDRTIPRITHLSVLNQGFQLWALSISPAARIVLREIEELAEEGGFRAFAVLLARRPRRR